jgi:uncharacterized membrane protein
MQRMYNVAKYILYFFIYSLLGAAIETLIRLVTEHELYGIHGFLHVPVFPIFGFGALLIVILLRKQIRHPIPLFVLGALLATSLEFLAHWVIEVVFGDRIWDYSSHPFNLDGRISLYASIGFGVGAVLLVHFLHPLVEKFVGHIYKQLRIYIATILLTILCIDFVWSVAVRLNN